MIIAVDLDDTLADSLTSFIHFHNKNYNTSLKYKDFTAYTLNEIMGMPKEEEAKRLEEFDNSKHFEEIKPLKEAVEAVSELAKKHKIIIITGRAESSEKKTRAWVKKNLPMIKDIFFIRKVYHETPKNKADVCKKINADILIDDNLNHVHNCNRAGVKAILIDYPWNRNAKLGKLIQRVKSWKEIVKFINKIEEKLK